MCREEGKHRKDRTEQQNKECHESALRLVKHPSLIAEREYLFLLECIIKNLSWIHNKCKIVTGDHPGLFCTPNFLDLSTDPVSLDSITVMTDRNYHNPINIQLVLTYDKFQPTAGIMPAGLENSVNLRFTFYNFLFRKASSHHIRTACVCLWLFCGPKPGDRPLLPYEP